jgi:hypothetical protein
MRAVRQVALPISLLLHERRIPCTAVLAGASLQVLLIRLVSLRARVVSARSWWVERVLGR